MFCNVPIALLQLGHNALGAICPKQLGVFWHLIDWQRVHYIVKNLQGRLVKAVQNGKWRIVRSLQRLLTTSMSGKLLAIRRVTENKGRQSAGIDKVLWDSPAKKWQARLQLRTQGYKAQAVRVVKIPKKNGKWRKLGIPTMRDRAMQALYLLALDPISETLADGHSYGFRKYRSCADAIRQCHIVLCKGSSPTWILEADIKGCFDHINHDWLLKHIPLPNRILRTWLKSGQIGKDGKRFSTTEGTPQGAIISPTLANMTLDGLQPQLYEAMDIVYRSDGGIKYNPHQIHFIRYADDFIITSNNPSVLTHQVKPLVVQFLQQRGLQLSEAKTQITHIHHGFDFLGKTIRKFNGKLLTYPSKANVQTFLHNIKTTIKRHPSVKSSVLIHQLNPKIKGWAMYHRADAAKATFYKVEHLIWQMIWKWCVRRHGNKGKRWVQQKYFTCLNNDHWTFYDTDENDNIVYLMKMGKVRIKRHTKIRSSANPYDPMDEPYFEKRIQSQLLNQHGGKVLLRQLYRRQKGKCPRCQQMITQASGWNIHHRIPRYLGGATTWNNLILLHPVCHQQVHYTPNTPTALLRETQ